MPSEAIAPSTSGAKRRAHDFYPTPPALAAACIATLPQDYPARLLDLGAGAGVWGAAARERWPHAHITGIELRDVDPHPAYNRWYTIDALGDVGGGPYDMVIGNPPYSLALPFVRRGLDLVREGGIVAMLLRLSFLEPTRDRAPFLIAHPPIRMHVAQRARFNPESKGTDNTPPAFITWPKVRGMYGPGIGVLQWKEGAQ